jgi:hypothetical protein
VFAGCGQDRTRGWFGKKVRYIGALLRDGDEPALLGTGVLGSRGRDGEFVVHEELVFD